MATLTRDLAGLIDIFLSMHSHRSEALFSQFLPQGYEATTLSSVPQSAREATTLAKIHLGLLITLYDDLADHPALLNTALLDHLYRLNLDDLAPTLPGASHKEIETIALAQKIHLALVKSLSSFPHYRLLREVLRFDLEQFYLSNRLSSLMTTIPSMTNLAESTVMGPHNMGIVAAGTIDLMASPTFSVSALGRCREALLIGQRMGRISNVIFTYDREVKEGDQTNEILVAKRMGAGDDYRDLLIAEHGALHSRLSSFPVSEFDPKTYADGLLELHRLHQRLEGRI